MKSKILSPPSPPYSENKIRIREKSLKEEGGDRWWR